MTTTIQKISYINKYDILEQIKETTASFTNENTEEMLSMINGSIQAKFVYFSLEIYQTFKDELHEEFRDNLDELKKLVIKHCSPTVGKVLWVKYLLTEIEKGKGETTHG